MGSLVEGISFQLFDESRCSFAGIDGVPYSVTDGDSANSGLKYRIEPIEIDTADPKSWAGDLGCDLSQERKSWE